MTYEETLRNLPEDRTTDIMVTHHIIPTSCGGTDDKDNLIRLTPAQHMWVHVIREREGHKGSAKMFLHSLGKELDDVRSFDDCLPYNGYFRMLRKMMSDTQKRYWADPEKRAYRVEQYAAAKRGKVNVCAGRRWITDGEKGKRIPAECELPPGWRYGMACSRRVSG